MINEMESYAFVRAVYINSSQTEMLYFSSCKNDFQNFACQYTILGGDFATTIFKEFPGKNGNEKCLAVNFGMKTISF